jgi:hypothetical protein
VRLEFSGHQRLLGLLDMEKWTRASGAKNIDNR